MNLYTCLDTVIVVKKIALVEREGKTIKIYMDGGVTSILSAASEAGAKSEIKLITKAMLDE